MGWLRKEYCPFGCGAERGFCQCARRPASAEKQISRAKVVQNGKVVQGKPAARPAVRAPKHAAKKWWK